jgi:hypothetical protein
LIGSHLGWTTGGAEVQCGSRNIFDNHGLPCPCSKMNLAQLGGNKQERAASPISRGSTLIAMMQAADLREGNNVIACEG